MPKRNSLGPVHGGTGRNVRLALAILVGLALAIVFGAFGPTALNFIYTAIARRETKLWDFGPLSVIPMSLLGIFVGFWLGNVIADLFQHIGNRWEKMDTGERFTLFLGVFAGLVASIPFLLLVNQIGVNLFYLPLLIIGLTLGFSSMAIYMLQSMRDILPWHKNKGPAKRSGIKILDTNVIIDARIYDIAKTGFLEGEIYVPKFVLEELQHIADHSDSLRRARGRRGLEVLKHLQAEFPMEVGKYDSYAPDQTEEVDSRLVRIAKAIGADIVTNDWNLNSVAKLQNVKILSLNELSLTLRPNVLPQESLNLSIIREGNQLGQGIGYLDDGTMVVVENGKSHIGETMDVTVTQVIQTERGKMIFAEVDAAEEDSEAYYSRRPRRR